MALTQVPSEAIADGSVGTPKLADGAATTANGSDTFDAGSVNIIYE